MIEARAGRDLTYSATRSGSEKCLLPTIATLNQPAVDALLPIRRMFLSNISRSLAACRS
jgi:hypothetical protein